MKCRRLVWLCSLLLATGCRDTIQPELPGLSVRIIAPAPGDSLYAPDTVTFLGEATASDVGLLAHDSLWWTDNGLPMGRGRAVRHPISPGVHVYRLHARHNEREDSATLVSTAVSGVGRILWTVALGPDDYDGVSLSPNGRLYALEDHGTAHAISLEGAVLWRSATGAGVFGHPPAIGADGTIYYGHTGADDGSRGGLVAMAPTGARRWMVATGAPGRTGHHVHGGPAVAADGTIYFVSEERELVFYAVRPDGTLKWRAETSPAGGSSEFWTHPVLVGDSLVVAVEARDSLVAVSTVDGTLRWKVFISSTGVSFYQYTPAVGDDGTLYVARGNQLVAVRPDGTVRWRRPTSMASGSPTIGNGNLYLGSLDGGVTVLSLAGDSLRAFGRPHSFYVGSVTLGANGIVYVAGADTLYSYGPDGALRFATPVPHAPTFYSAQGGPVIGPEGNVYLRAKNLGVIAIRDTVGPAVGAPWPAFQGGPMRQGRRH